MSAENYTSAGGWIITQGELCIDKHPDAKAAFEKATNGLVGVSYTPVALLATQIVSGTNYCILCRAVPVVADPKPYICTMTIYADLSGNAVITGIKKLIGENACCLGAAADNAVLGGWEIVEGDKSIKVHPDAYKALVEASKLMVGVDFAPLDLLGTQTVSGKNYCILCRVAPVVPEARPSMQLVYVYEDTNGNASITEMKEIIGSSPLLGAYTANIGEPELDKNPEVKAAFDKAMTGLTGVDYVPVAYLGSQVVSGFNHLILCESTVVVPGAKPALSLVTIYADPAGNAEIKDIKPLEL